ncbi:hypothetical protein BJI47_21665 [Rhodococcus sp. 1168]|nr:hypothetical protein BJI47_21665 [Rhodococcus sp. 1168]
MRAYLQREAAGEVPQRCLVGGVHGVAGDAAVGFDCGQVDDGPTSFTLDHARQHRVRSAHGVAEIDLAELDPLAGVGLDEGGRGPQEVADVVDQDVRLMRSEIERHGRVGGVCDDGRDGRHLAGQCGGRHIVVDDHHRSPVRGEQPADCSPDSLCPAGDDGRLADE